MAARRCKKFGVVKSGPRKGKCRTRRVSTGKKRSSRKKLSGAAARARACKGKRGLEFAMCLTGSSYSAPSAPAAEGMTPTEVYGSGMFTDGLGRIRRRRRSRR